MTLQDLGALGDMIGGIAVVASLIYLAIQIRQNTRQIAKEVEANRMAAFERNVESANRVRELLIVNPEITDVFLSGLRDYSGLEARDRFRFDQLMRNVMASFQGSYLRQRAYDTDPRGFEGAGRIVDTLLRSPGVRDWLAQGEFDWRPEFESFVLERLEAAKRSAAKRDDSSSTR